MSEKEKLLVRIDYLRCIADDVSAEECERMSKMIDNVIDKACTFRTSCEPKGCNIVGEGKLVGVPL